MKKPQIKIEKGLSLLRGLRVKARRSIVKVRTITGRNIHGAYQDHNSDKPAKYPSLFRRSFHAVGVSALSNNGNPTHCNFNNCEPVPTFEGGYKQRNGDDRTFCVSRAGLPPVAHGWGTVADCWNWERESNRLGWVGHPNSLLND